MPVCYRVTLLVLRRFLFAAQQCTICRQTTRIVVLSVWTLNAFNNLLQQQPRRARASNARSMKEPSLSDADDIESQGSSDVEVQSAEEEEDDDYEA